jgi:serine/threonine protein kinase
LHRDLKASNLLVDNQGVFKVCNFGLARPSNDVAGLKISEKMMIETAVCGNTGSRYLADILQLSELITMEDDKDENGRQSPSSSKPTDDQIGRNAKMDCARGLVACSIQS